MEQKNSKPNTGRMSSHQRLQQTISTINDDDIIDDDIIDDDDNNTTTNLYKNTSQAPYNATATASTTTDTSTNLYAIRKIEPKKKVDNQPISIATTVEELKTQLIAGKICIRGTYVSVEYNKNNIEISRDLATCIDEFTENVCKALKEKNPAAKLSSPIDKRTRYMKIKDLPVRSDAYIPGQEYDLCLTVTKPWIYEGYIGITFKGA